MTHRRYFPWLVFLLGVGVLNAGEKDPNLMERVTGKPDMSLVNPMQGKAFEDGGGFQIKNASVVDKDVGIKGFPSHNYRMTRSFLGIKNPWFGSRVFESKSSRDADKGYQQNNKPFAVEAAAVREYPFPLRSAAAGKPDVPTRAYEPRGTAQGSVDAVEGNTTKKLSVEDVREILNKNK